MVMLRIKAWAIFFNKNVEIGNYIDAFLIIPLAWGFIRGLFKGLIMALGSFFGLVIGVLLAQLYAPDFAATLIKWFEFSSKVSYVISYFIVFVVVSLFFVILSKLLEKVVKLISLGWVNKLFGSIFGLLKYALILSVLINLGEKLDGKINIISDQKKEESMLYYPLQKMIPTLLPFVECHQETSSTDER